MTWRRWTIPDHMTQVQILEGSFTQCAHNCLAFYFSRISDVLATNLPICVSSFPLLTTKLDSLTLVPLCHAQKIWQKHKNQQVSTSWHGKGEAFPSHMAWVRTLDKGRFTMCVHTTPFHFSSTSIYILQQLTYLLGSYHFPYSLRTWFISTGAALLYQKDLAKAKIRRDPRYDMAKVKHSLATWLRCKLLKVAYAMCAHNCLSSINVMASSLPCWQRNRIHYH